MTASTTSRGPRTSTTAPSARKGLPARLREGPPLVLDGPTGTALEARGIPLPPPLWSLGAVRGHADALAAVHRGYAEAGAEVVTSATFHAHPRTLAAAGVEDPETLVAEAVALARSAGARYVAGGLGPVADCYRPQDVPADRILADEHGAATAWLVRAGVDLLLLETLGTAREAGAAARAAARAGAKGTPFLVGLLVADGRLLGGEAVADAVRAVAPHGPAAIVLQCASPASVEAALPALRKAWAGPWGVVPNGGTGDPRHASCGGTPVARAGFRRFAQRMVQEGAAVLGSCCGSPVAFTADAARAAQRLR